MRKKIIKREFVFKIILPSLFVFSVFTILIFAVIIPSIKTYMLNDKREMIRELVNSAWSVLDEFDKEVEDSLLTLTEAKKEAIKRIENMRYGQERKDYFWITDMHPNMIMHPYRRELNNNDLSNYKDPNGNALFIESVNVVKKYGEGYIDYQWQWKDDSSRVVPKLSFVKGFEKWGWIVGTGIYIEDVNTEISSLTGSLFYISLTILIILGLNMVFIGRHSLELENKRFDAEQALRESEAKYRALVEASTDGLVMLLNGSFIYANQAFYEMLGYDTDDLESIDLQKLLLNSENEENTGNIYFKELVSGQSFQEKHTARLVKKEGNLIDVVLYTSKITLGQKNGFTIIIKDISRHKEIEEELDLNKEKFRTLANNIELGIIRYTPGRSGKIIEANVSASNILGFKTLDEIYDLNFVEFFDRVEERKNYIKKLADEGSVKNFVLQVKSKDGSVSVVAVSTVPVKNNQGEVEYYDSIMNDITEKTKLEENRENLMVELQTSLRFLNQPISHFLKHMVSCDMHMPISKVAKLMTCEKFSASLIKTEQGEYIGIITDHDLRRRVVAENYNLDKPILEVMSAPLKTISSSALVYEAFLKMNDTSIRHLAVTNPDGEIIGLISSEELLMVQRHSSSYLLREIEQAESVEELIQARTKLPILVKVLNDSGARSNNVSHIITSVFEAITNKLIAFAIKELGPPPVNFAFVALGSVGREEQTLISDQDNAIIYEDVDPTQNKKVHLYFHNLGIKVCDWLNDCGYPFCSGEAMAKNPKWCQALSVWKEYFHSWISSAEQQDLIDLSIFFDFRTIYGEADLSDTLRKHLFECSEGQAGFFQHLTKNCLLHKPPVGLLGKIIVESRGAHPETFDIKLATMPISDFCRIYALRNKICATNSIERLNGLEDKGILNKTTSEELKQAYNYLMQLRFRHQTEQIESGEEADNHLNPHKLTQIDQKTLKNIFTQILSIQKKLSYDFTGEAI